MRTVSTSEIVQDQPLDTDPLLEFESSSFADSLRDIMMPLSPSASMGDFSGDLTGHPFTARDVLNFGAETTWELSVFEPSFPLQIIDEEPRI